MILRLPEPVVRVRYNQPFHRLASLSLTRALRVSLSRMPAMQVRLHRPHPVQKKRCVLGHRVAELPVVAVALARGAGLAEVLPAGHLGERLALARVPHPAPAPPAAGRGRPRRACRSSSRSGRRWCSCRRPGSARRGPSRRGSRTRGRRALGQQARLDGDLVAEDAPLLLAQRGRGPRGAAGAAGSKTSRVVSMISSPAWVLTWTRKWSPRSVKKRS